MSAIHSHVRCYCYEHLISAVCPSPSALLYMMPLRYMLMIYMILPSFTIEYCQGDHVTRHWLTTTSIPHYAGRVMSLPSRQFVFIRHVTLNTSLVANRASPLHTLFTHVNTMLTTPLFTYFFLLTWHTPPYYYHSMNTLASYWRIRYHIQLTPPYHRHHLRLRMPRRCLWAYDNTARSLPLYTGLFSHACYHVDSSTSTIWSPYAMLLFLFATIIRWCWLIAAVCRLRLFRMSSWAFSLCRLQLLIFSSRLYHAIFRHAIDRHYASLGY